MGWIFITAEVADTRREEEGKKERALRSRESLSSVGVKWLARAHVNKYVVYLCEHVQSLLLGSV